MRGFFAFGFAQGQNDKLKSRSPVGMTSKKSNGNCKSNLAEYPGVVGDDVTLDVADGLVALEGDFAGDGFDDA